MAPVAPPAEIRPLAEVDAELSAGGMKAQLIRFDVPGPAENTLHENERFYWLDLSLTPRPQNVRACYRDRWSPHRFERIGKMFLVPPGETFHVRSDGYLRQTSIVCRFEPAILHSVLDSELEWTDRGLEASLDIQNEIVRGLLLRLVHETRYPGLASAVLVELIMAQLAIELGRYFTQVQESSSGGGLAPWRLRLIDEYLRDADRAPTLAELASLCKLSVRQLTRGFRASRGCSIGGYIAEQRITVAKNLLGADQSVKEIAYRLGYASPSSFCFAFRCATGVTPRDFRRRITRLV
jgi:AraC family transcriptional regulator